MKRFLVLAALVLGLASCQREPEGLDINVGGEVETTITVNIPESETRANNSGVGIFNNGVLEADDNLTMRYIFQVYYEGQTNAESRQVRYTDGTSVSFPVRLVPNRTYQFVVWADVVKGNNAGDNHYVTTDLKSITLSEPSTWVAMDETRDAFTATYEAANFNGTQAININLYRPFAKLRVVTTDYNELAKLNIEAKKATVRYTTDHRSTFNAYTGVAEAADKSNVTHEYTIAEYTEESDAARTIFSDYFFAEDTDIVKFEMLVEEENGDDIVTRVFNTDISVKPNYLTTLRGNVLTDGKDVNVDVQPGMGGTENPDINYNVLTSGAELLNAISNGGSYMLGQDIYVSSPAASTLALTRADEGKTTTINLNGFDITVENTGNEPFITVEEGDTLVFSGEGNVTLTDDSTAAFINNEGDVVLQGGTHSGNNSVDIITGDGNIFEAGGTIEQPEEDSVKTQLEALQFVFANGGEMTLTEDIEATETLVISTTNAVVINGGEKSINSAARYGIEITADNADVTLNNVNLEVSAESVYTSYICGIKLTTNNSELTLNNCNVGFNHPSAHDWAYAVNQPYKENNVININGGSYEGANVVNIWGKNHVVNIDGATLTSLYQYNKMYVGCCIRINSDESNQATGNKVTAKNATFNGDYAVAAMDSGTNNTITLEGCTDNTKRPSVLDADTDYGYLTIADALADGATNIHFIDEGEYTLPLGLEAKSGDVVKLIGDVEGVVLLGTNNAYNNNALPGNYASGMNLSLENVTYKTINNGYSGGFGGTKSVTFTDCEIIGQMYAHSNAPHYFYGCTIDPLNGYLYTYASNCVFEGCYFRASEGKALQVYAEAAGTFTTTIKNCRFEAFKQAQTWDKKPVTGIDINSANGAKMVVAIENCTTEGFPVGLNSSSDLFNVKCDLSLVTLTVDGLRWVAPNVFLNEAGQAVVGDTTGLKAAVAAGYYDIALKAGVYETKDFSFNGKTLKLTGIEEGAKILNSQNNAVASGAFDSCKVAFKDLTIETLGGIYKGFARMEATYTNCNFVNNYFTFQGKHEFVGCKFDAPTTPKNEHCLWTYGASELNFTECEFNYNDRCINVYMDNGKSSVSVAFDKCKFNTDNAASVGAVEINASAFPQGATLSFTECTAPANGHMVFISKWDPTAGATATVTVDGVAYTTPIQQ